MTWSCVNRGRRSLFIIPGFYIGQAMAQRWHRLYSQKELCSWEGVGKTCVLMKESLLES